MKTTSAILLVTFTVVLFAILSMNATSDRQNAKQGGPSGSTLDSQEFSQRILQKSEKDIVFIENLGQIKDTKGEKRPDILFLTRSEGVDMYMTNSGITYVFRKIESDINDQSQSALAENTDLKEEPNFYRLDMEFVGMNRNITIRKELALEQQYHYYTPEYPDGISPRAYKKLTIENLYEGIDLVYYEKAGRMKYDFVLKPGADADSIQMKYQGAESLDIDEEGSVIITTPMGEIREEKPYTYSGSTGLEIESRYEVKDNTVLFEINEYDKSEDIIIDPVRIWATYYGGRYRDQAFDICTDNSGNLYVTGRTESRNFPIQTLKGAYHQDTIGGQTTIFGLGAWDAFILKFNSSGARIWATYYGGSDHDMGHTICTDNSGHFYVAGETASSNFPIQTLKGAYNQTTSGDTSDAFILKFDSNCVRQWATYYGGSGIDRAWGICTDNSDNIYVTGETVSSNFPTQTLTGAYNQTTSGDTSDAFILKFDSNCVRQWATYYGGSDIDRAWGICTDNSDNIYVTGETASSNFPTQTLTGAYNQTNSGGSSDAFILKFDSSCVRQWATYYGGSGSDGEGAVSNQAWWFGGGGICTDNSGNFYVTGETASSNFPTQTLTGAYNQTTLNGNSDVFILKFNGNSVREWATYYGGSELDIGHEICTDNSGNVFLTGQTTSSNFPTQEFNGDFNQSTFGGERDVFILEFDSSCVRHWATYYGGNHKERGQSIYADHSGNLYATGGTASSNFPTMTLTGAYNDSTFALVADVFILRFDVGTLVATNDVPEARSDRNISDLSVYPNPANELLTIRYRLNRQSRIMMRITDIKGAHVHDQHDLLKADMQANQIDVSQMPAGIYFLYLGSEDQVISRKFVIQR